MVLAFDIFVFAVVEQ